MLYLLLMFALCVGWAVVLGVDFRPTPIPRPLRVGEKVRVAHCRAGMTMALVLDVVVVNHEGEPDGAGETTWYWVPEEAPVPLAGTLCRLWDLDGQYLRTSRWGTHLVGTLAALDDPRVRAVHRGTRG